MTRDFHQFEWDEQLAKECRQLIRLAREEDLGQRGDLTSLATIPAQQRGKARLVSRQQGVLAGGDTLRLVAEEFAADVQIETHTQDGAALGEADVIATLHGNVRNLLAAERTMINFVSRLSGIATNARRFVEAVRGTGADIYDTRKTTPAWRRLETYAVRCGGACNHRTGLFDAILIKDNHVASAVGASPDAEKALAEMVVKARRFVGSLGEHQTSIPVEIEVDSLKQLAAVLLAGPDIILLDNMSLADLRSAVKQRDTVAPSVILEASGGVSLETIREIAESGVDRISCGAITHQARWLDLGLDWA